MSQSSATKMSKSLFSGRGAAFLLASLGAGCSSSGSGPSGGANPPDGGNATDGENPLNTNSADGGTAGDAAGVGNTSDGGGSTGGTILSVNLGTAGSYAILAKSGISTVPASAITGDLGVSPAAATYLTGFVLTADSTKLFSTSSQVTGKLFASNYAMPTPSNLTTAVGDMQLAFTDAAGRTPGVTELGAGNIGGKTLAPGVYKWGTGLQIPTDVTLTGNATDVWIFQIAQDLTMSSGTKIVLSGGAMPKNIFWQVAGLVAMGTTSHCEGVVLTKTSIALKTGASINGRLLAQTAVTLDSSTVVAPAP